jgi:hypothetical protein
MRAEVDGVQLAGGSQRRPTARGAGKGAPQAQCTARTSWGSLLAISSLLGIASGCESEPLQGKGGGQSGLLAYTQSGAEIACGQERCVVGEQACCWPGSGLSDGFCISIADAESGAAVVENCHALDVTVSRALTCQGMSDCVDGATCCNEEDHTSRCLPAPAAGENPCTLYESCRATEPCFGAETLCFDYFDEQLCLKTGQSVSCGDKECEGATQACCYSPEASPAYACRGLNACNPVDGTRYSCTAPDDCAPGYSCCAVDGGGGTICLGECVSQVCSTDDDCPASAPSCVEADGYMPGLKTCN